MALIKEEIVDARYFDCSEYPVPDGAILQELGFSGNEIAGYGIPNDEHDCDEMGCPSIGHVLFVLKVRSNHE